MRTGILVLLLTFSLIGYSGCDNSGDEHDHNHDTAVTHPEIKQNVQAGCASCIFNMPEVEGCQLAVKIGDEAYMVSGVDIDAHSAGLCSASKQAEISGGIEGDQFVATNFKLVP